MPGIQTILATKCNQKIGIIRKEMQVHSLSGFKKQISLSIVLFMTRVSEAVKAGVIKAQIPYTNIPPIGLASVTHLVATTSLGKRA